MFTETLTASNGCDSIIVYDVQVGNTYNICLGDTTLCYGEMLQVGSTLYDSRTKSSGQWGDFSLKTELGCDSVVFYNVVVTAPIEPQIKYGEELLTMPYCRVDIEAGQVSVDLEISGTGFDAYTVSYVDANGVLLEDVHTPADVLLSGLPVNEYIFAFTNAAGCELVDTVLVGGDTLCLELMPQIQCECGKPVLNIPFHKCAPANKARLASCSLKFAEADKQAQGFEDSVYIGLKDEDTIRIAVPAGAEPGLYPIDLIFDTVIGGCIWGQNAFHTAIMLTYDSSVIYHRWTENAIISLVGPSVAKKTDGSDYALYAFSDFQWLHNGVEVEGATLSYMEQPGILNMSDTYALRMMRADGQIFTTCSYIPGHRLNAPSNQSVAPAASVTPVDPLSGSPVEISLTEDAEVDIYGVMGNKVLSCRFDKGTSSFVAPAISGVYVVSVHTRTDVLTLRIRVR